jgi:hypothetical protein
VYDEDLNFEGIAAQFAPHSQSSRTIRPFLTVGVFPLQEVEQSDTVKAKSKWLYGAQTGLEWGRPTGAKAKIAAAYYDFQNVQGIRNDFGLNEFDETAPEFRQKGNTLFLIDPPTNSLFALAPEYAVLDVTAQVDIPAGKASHVILTGTYVDNVGFDQAEILARTGLDLAPETSGYLARAAVGMSAIKKAHDWQMFVTYRRLERDAVLDAFTDSDFHLGGTNNKGYVLGGQYGVGKNAWFVARWLSSNEISGLPLGVDVLQLDFNVRF